MTDQPGARPAGARLTAETRAKLSELGFTDFAETEDGFSARCSREEAMRVRA